MDRGPVLPSDTPVQLRVHKRGIDFDWLEERFVPLGFRLVFCVRHLDTFDATRAERLKVSGKPDPYGDLSQFIEERELMRRLVAGSRVPALEVDVSEGDIGAITDAIADWLTETGGLWQS